MATALSLFPARVRFVNDDGTLTPEAYRALQQVYQRIGGSTGDMGNDTAASFQQTQESVLGSTPVVQGVQPQHALDAPIVQSVPAEYVPESVMQPHQFEAWKPGMLLISLVATDPSILLGYGTWAQVGAGRVLVGLDTGDVDFDTLEETGGAKTKAISAHTGTNVSAGVVSVDPGAGGTDVFVPPVTVTQPNNHTDLNVVQPYFVCIFWRRIS